MTSNGLKLRRSWRSIVLVAFGLSCLPVLATSDDDYAQGEKSYRSGDVAGAMAQLRKAADAGHAKAQARLAEILDASDFNEEAVGYYRKSADQGEPNGIFGLANMYAMGEGVKKDTNEAYKLYVSAAEKGQVDALKVLASAYIFGQLGIDAERRNSDEAGKWIKLAAEQDYVPAVEALVRAYRTGGFGLGPDAQQAASWDEKLKKLRRDGSAIKKR